MKMFSSMVDWIIEIEETAEFSGVISIAEICVAFCLDHRSSFTEICTGSAVNCFVPTTFSAHLRKLKKELFSIFWTAGVLPEIQRVSLPDLGVHVGLEAFNFSWSRDLTSPSRDRLREFVSGQPIRNAQGFSKPWRPVGTN